MHCRFPKGVGRLNLAVLFLSDIDTSSSWSEALIEEVAEDAMDWEVEVLHCCRGSPDLILGLPEGTKVWQARVAFETAWRTVTGQSPSFVSRSARQAAIAYMTAKAVTDSIKATGRPTSAGIVYLDTHKSEDMLNSEEKRLWESLHNSPCANLIHKQQLGTGNILFVKAGKESDDPSFKRIARIVQDCFRSVIDIPLHVAGRGMETVLKEIHDVIEEHAPKMISDESLLQEVKREIEI